MDEGTVRQHAEAHGKAVVQGDLRTAGGDLTPEAQALAPDVMGRLPRDLTGSEVVTLESVGEESVLQTRYDGSDRSVTVESRWAERDGRPKIIDMKVV